jgi:flavodoxin/ferredoxin
MKCIIIYYSQTGNTKKIAKAIYAGVRRAADHSDIARLKDINPKDLMDYDLIGLGSPVFHCREHTNVRHFINSMKSLDGKHAFAFCTHGTLPAYYFAEVIPAMIQRAGLIVIGWDDWFGSGYHPILPKPYFTDGHPDEIDLKEAEDFGKEMVERSKRISLGETQLIPILPKGSEYYKRYFPVSDSFSEPFGELELIHHVDFKINLKKCNYPKCTHCVDNCPTNAINMSISPPVFSKDCEVCFLCEQTCPYGAIECDYELSQNARNPLNASLLQQSRDMWEERGSFRRLIADDDIGWDTPLWKYKKPRFKIDY